MADLRNLSEKEKAQYNAQKWVKDAKFKQQYDATQSFGNGLLDLGMTVNGFMPVTGDIQSGLLAANDIKQGNYGSAALNGLGVLPFIPSMAGLLGSISSKSKGKLVDVLDNIHSGKQGSRTVRDAIDLTPKQVNDLSKELSKQYPNINVPNSINYKVQHAYDSRVTKDGFSPDDVYKWSVAGADDSARVVDYKGKTALKNRFVDDARGVSYDVRMPVRGDALGNVWTDDVIPEGLFGTGKKNAPLASRSVDSSLPSQLPTLDAVTGHNANIAQQVEKSIPEYIDNGWKDADYSKDALKKHYMARIADERGNKFVKGKLVLYKNPDGSFEVSNIDVASDSRGNGIAKQLLQNAFDDTGAGYFNHTGFTGDGLEFFRKNGLDETVSPSIIRNMKVKGILDK